MIIKIIEDRRPMFLLVSGKGKILGKHRTISEARSQEAAINISKARAAGHRIPRRAS